MDGAKALLVEGSGNGYLKTACDYVHLNPARASLLRRRTAPRQQKANRVIAQETSRRGWTEADLACRLRNDPGKLAMAARVRKETTLPLK